MLVCDKNAHFKPTWYLYERRSNLIVNVTPMSRMCIPPPLSHAQLTSPCNSIACFEDSTWLVGTNQNSLFRSRDWLLANQGPVFGTCFWVTCCKASSLSELLRSFG
eukprot:sb/3477827/